MELYIYQSGEVKFDNDRHLQASSLWTVRRVISSSPGGRVFDFLIELANLHSLAVAT